MVLWKLSDLQENYLSKINSSSKLLLGIINDILDYSKIEANKLELEYREFDMQEAILQVRMIFSQSAIDKGLEFAVELKNETPKDVIGDELRIKQILINLLSNSLS